jgi:hypothetical protein
MMRFLSLLFLCSSILCLPNTAAAQKQPPKPDPFPGCGTDEHIRYLRHFGIMPGENQKVPGSTGDNPEMPPLAARCDLDGGIPLVVHIIHLGEPIGTGSNISDAQVQQAVDGLNDWWNNISGNGIPLGLSFKLATRDLWAIRPMVSRAPMVRV